jgi:TP901 family phage tail tape measure protein
VSDENKNIQINLALNNGEKIPTLLRQLQQVKQLADTAFQKASQGNVESAKSLERLNGIYDKLVSKIQQYNSALTAGTGNDKWLNSQLKAMETQERLLERQKKLAESWKYDSTPKGDQLEFGGPVKQKGYANPEFVAQMKEQFAARQAIQEAQERTAIDSNRRIAQAEANRIKETTSLLRKQMEESATANLFRSYSSQLSGIRSEAQKYFQLIQSGTGDVEAHKRKYAELKTSAEGVFSTMNRFNRDFGQLDRRIFSMSESLNYYFAKARSHLSWIASGAIIAGLIAVPVQISHITKETETLGLKIKQNLELMDKYKDSHGALESDVKHLSDVAGVFAVGYQTNVTDVMEMMQILSRRFKSPEELTYYTNMALIMHKLDFVAPKKAAEDLEAVILSMGLDFKQARLFIDQFSVAVHSARITGTDLLSGLQRSGATMKNMNLNTAEAIAMISTLSTVTAKAGPNIGAALNSVLVNIDFKKAAQALKAYSIEVYDANGNMNKGVEIWREIARVFNGLPDNKANEFANAMSGGKFRANDMRALLDNWNEFEKILTNINEKASPELTSKLLQTAMESYQNALNKASASLQILGMTLGNEALPALKEMTNGLTEGVQWLTKHREEVSKAMEAIWLISKALVAYKTYQFLANTQAGNFAGRMMGIVSTSATFTGAVTSIGRSFLGILPAIALASAKLAIFLALAEAASKIGSKLSQNNQEKEFLESVQGAGSRDAGGGRELTAEEKEVIEAIDARNAFTNNVDFTPSWEDKGKTFERLDKKVAEKLQKVQMSRSLDGVNALVEAAAKKMSDKPVDIQKLTDQVTGQDIGGGGGKGPANPPDPAVMTRKRDQFALQQQYNELQNQSKISNLQYTDSLERLSMVEDIYGKTVATNTARIDLRNYRVGQLGTQYRNAEDMLKSFEEQLDTAIAKDKDLSAQMKQVYVDWDNMSKAQKYEAVKDNNDLKGNYTLMKWLIDKVGELKVKLAELKGETNKVANENIKLATSGYFSREQTYNRNLEASNRNTSHATAMATNEYDPYNDKQLLAIRIQGAKANQKLYDAELLGLKAEFEAAKKAYDDEGDFKVKQSLLFQVEQTQLAYDKQRQIVERTTKEIADLEQSKNDKINSGMAGIVSDLAIQGNSLKDIWKNLWSGLAQEAINQLFRIKGAQSSVLGNLLGFGGESSATKGLSDYVAMPTFGSSIPQFATGGRNSKETIAHISEGDKAEWIIPTADKQRGRQLWLQAGDELGMTTERVPYLKDPDLAQKFSSGGEGLSSTAHLAKLDTQNALMLQQNQMLAAIANNSQGGGNVAVLQVQASDEQILAAIKRNPQVLAGLMRQAQSGRM